MNERKRKPWIQTGRGFYIVLARFVLCDHHFPGEEFCFLMYASGPIGHDITLKF